MLAWAPGLGYQFNRMISFIDYLFIHLFISNSQHRTTSIYIISRMEATGEQVGIAHDFGRL